MTLKCLSADLRKVDRKPIPESSYPLIFTPEWLEAINHDLEGRPLHNCLVASENGIVPVPWTRITSPEFIDDRPPTVNVPSSDGDSCPLHLRSPQEPHQTSPLDSKGSVTQSWASDRRKLSRDKYPGLIKVEPARPGQMDFRVESEASQDPEEDYVALLSFPQECRRESPDREVVTLSVDTQRLQGERLGAKEATLLGRVLPLPGPDERPPSGRRACAEPAGSGEKAYSGGSRRKARHKASVCITEKPHSGIQEKPLDCTSTLVRDTKEESAASKIQRSEGMPEPGQAFSLLLSPADPVAPASETKTEETTPEHSRAAKPGGRLGRSTSSRVSLAPGLQLSLRGQKEPYIPPEKAPLQHGEPWKAPCPLNSLQPCGTRAVGKGKNPHSARQGLDLPWFRRLWL